MQWIDSLVGRENEERKRSQKNGNPPESGFAVHECGHGTASRPSKAEYPTESFHHAPFAVAWFNTGIAMRCYVIDDLEEMLRNEFAH